MAFMGAPDFRADKTKMAGSFMPDLKPGYNPVRMRGLMVVGGNSNDV
jgi:hypothetical protein